MNPRYKKMLQIMAVKNKRKTATNKKCDEPWYLYILRCNDRSFYTGITKDIEQRVKKHNDGKGAAYTRTHKPVKLVYQEICADRTSALIQEMKIKKMSRKKKEELVMGTNKNNENFYKS